MDGFCRLFLSAVGLIFCVVGLIGLLSPKTIMEPVQLLDMSVSTTAELRAAYGGTFLALATGAFLALKHHAYAPLVLTLFAVALGVFSGARALSLIVDGHPNVFSVAMQLLEGFGFVLTIVALKRQTRLAQ